MLAFYEITRACDLACRHCRACAQSKPHPQELSPQASRALIDQLAEFSEPPMLVITGGDPFKRADLFDLVAHARARGLQVSLTPSATPLVTREALARLQEAGISRLALSLDGADAATHDGIRGVPGIFECTLHILAEARALGIETQVNTTITPGNVSQIDALAELLARQGIALWSVFFLVPVGRALHAPRLNGVRMERVFQKLWEHARRQPYAIKTTEAPHYRRFALQQMHRARAADAPRVPWRMLTHAVNDGKGILFISHTGLIHPSGFLPVVCGMFPLDHVVAVYQNSPVFRMLRDADVLEGKCGACEYRHVCGGSRARAFAVTGNLLAQEPDCDYAPAAWQIVDGT